MNRLIQTTTWEITEIDKKYNSIFRNIFRLLWEQEKKESFFRLIDYLYINIWNILNKRELSNKTRISFDELDEFFVLMKKYKLFSKVLPFFTNSKDENSLHFKVYSNNINLINFLEKKLWKQISYGNKIENLVYIYLKKLPFTLRTYKKICGNEIDFILLDKHNYLIPIEVKSWNSVSIHKWFQEFQDRYKSKIKYFIKTTKNKTQKKNMWNNTIHFIPFNLLNSFINDIQK